MKFSFLQNSASAALAEELAEHGREDTKEPEVAPAVSQQRIVVHAEKRRPP